MDRLEIANPMRGIAHMIVCCEKDCTNEEILAFCNDANPAGTTLGWCTVIREDFHIEKARPVPCADDPSRVHIMVGC